MAPTVRIHCGFLALLGVNACDTPPADGPDASAALPPRPAVQTCKPAPLDPNRLPDLSPRPVLDDLDATGAVGLVESPRGDGWYVVRLGTVTLVGVGPGAGAPVVVLDLPGRRLLDFALGARFAFVLSTVAGEGVAVRIPLDPATRVLDPRTAAVLATFAGEAGSLAQDEAGGLFVAGSEVLYFVDPEGESPTSEVFATGLAGARCSADGGELWCVSGADVHRLQHGDVAGPGTRVTAVAPDACPPTRGHVYRGPHWPELFGAYVFAHGCTGEVVGLRLTGPIERTLAHVEQPVGLLTRDGQGRLLALPPDGRVRRLEVAAPDTHLGWPDRLSQTGCFTSLVPLTPGPDLVPYELNAPLWTDGAEKTRFFVLPPGERVTATDAGEWGFPEGSVLVKHFAFPGADGRAQGVETRFMVRQPFGWSFHTYRWDEGGQDATLLDGLDEDWRTLEVNGSSLRYFFPSRLDCHACHNRRAEMVLGPRAAQLDRRSARGAPQLDLYAEAGLIDHRPVTAPLPDPHDAALPLADRARAWLHANCAHCHQPGGWTPPDLDLDLRFDTPLAATRLCAPAQYPAFDFGPDRIVPGHPEASNLYQRLTTEGFGRMPLIGTSRTDPLVDAVIRPWIEAGAGCP